MKHKRGFTLVELLAVIVILAIIMIIAIPAVLNTMTSAKRKSIITFAQKAMNEAEKQYLLKQTMGELSVSTTDSKFYFDIRKDLDLSNTGDYYGSVTIGISKNHGNYSEIRIISNDLYLNYSSWEHLDNLDDDNVRSLNIKDMYGPVDLSTINFKEFYAAVDHCGRCGWDDSSFTDAATNTKIFDSIPSYRNNGSYENGTWVCNDADEEELLFDKTLYTYFYNHDKIGDCDYIWNIHLG